MDNSPFDRRSSEAVAAMALVDDVDRARAEEYALLATLLARSPDATLLKRLAGLVGDATPLGTAHASLAAVAARADAAALKQEYFDLFGGLASGGLVPYASYYLTGFLYGRPLARLREALRRLGIERVGGMTEPEDHAAILFEIMAGLVGGRIVAPPETDREIFETHLLPWIGRFTADLERAKPGGFYAIVGTLARIFVEIEAEGFALPR